ncbi:MAG: hypothetical protein SF028_06065 [Candidatus Sumerlaeia bacterium]|nr:hypothetical protein [Candidatus Sumerlaeia bacterium]
MIPRDLLDILACPLSRAPLVLDGGRLVSTDPETRRAYRIEGGIPVMLIDEATTLAPEDHAEILRRHGAEPMRPPQKKEALR